MIFIFVLSLAFTQPTELSGKITAGAVVLCTAGFAASIKKDDGTEFSAEEKAMLEGVQKLLDNHAGEGLTEDKASTLIADALKDFKPEIQGMLKEDSLNELKEAMKLQGKELAKLNLTKAADEKTVKGILAMLAEQFETKEFIEEMASFKSSVAGVSKHPLTMAVKAPINAFNPSANAMFATSEDFNITRAPEERVRMSDYVKWLPSDGKVSHTYTEEVSTTGSAAVVDCGVLKPAITVGYKRQTVDPFKIAAHIKECDDLLIYIPKLKAALQELLMRKLADARDVQLLNVITTAATTYNLITLATTNPNEFDAIRATVAQARMLNHNPSHVFLNPIDAANFEMTKGIDEHYIFICTCEGGVMKISNLQVVETSQIPVGDFLVADMSLMNVKAITNVIIRMGYGITDSAGHGGGGAITDDLVHDVLTIVSEQFMTMYIKELDGNGFIYSDFATVIAAL